MAKKIRKQTLGLESYLKKVKAKKIMTDQEVQRVFCWDNEMINELICSVLTENYIPPIILAEIEEENGTRSYIVDGMQRTSALYSFKYLNYKITSKIENPYVEYQREKTDEKGKVIEDEYGNPELEVVQFDIRGKHYDDLPQEIKDLFDDYQIESAIHQNCTKEEISRYVRRYNNHKSMSASQKAFTFIDRFARDFRNISGSLFFKDCIKYSDAERKKGTYENLVGEAIAATFHIDQWKKVSKDRNKFLNENITMEQIKTIEEYANRLHKACLDQFQDVFVLKDLAVWFAVFHRFNEYGLEDGKFAEFLSALREELHSVEVDGMTYDELASVTGTKDTKTIKNKIAVYTSLMEQFLHIYNKEETHAKTEETAQEFIEKTLGKGFDDMELYNGIFEDLTLNVDNNSALMENDNRKSMLCLIAWSIENDIDLDEWIVNFFGRNTTYIKDQKENFTYMKQDLENYKGEAA